MLVFCNIGLCAEDRWLNSVCGLSQHTQSELQFVAFITAILQGGNAFENHNNFSLFQYCDILFAV